MIKRISQMIDDFIGNMIVGGLVLTMAAMIWYLILLPFIG